MTRTSVQDYARVLRERYLLGNRAEKAALLDEFCRNTGYHRKAAIRLLRHPPRPKRGRRRGRRPQYGTEVAQALCRLWESTDRMCGKRLAPFLSELVAHLEHLGEVRLPPEVRAQVVQLSAATVDRLLQPWRSQPLRTFGDWQDVLPGACQADLVAHCGDSVEGFHLTSLCLVDVATSWTELEAVWGKGQQRVCAGVHLSRVRLPMGLRELHTDNGSEFLNHLLYPYCQHAGIRLTRGRPYRKNDQAYVEQRNGHLVRRVVGYDRYSSKAAFAALQRVYGLLRPYVNFFQPVQKVVSKERVGAKVIKRYDRAQTPYQRVLTSGVLSEEQRQRLEQQYRALNPVRLRAELEVALEVLWDQAQRPQRPQPGALTGTRG